jgi:DNA-binding response OmpR family regulator
MLNIILSELEHATQFLPENVIDDKRRAPYNSKSRPCSDKGFNILIVDDDTDILECYKMLFELEGYHTEAASTPVEALEKVKASRFDLAILDYTLPHMRGDELAIRLLQINHTMKLLFISGHSDAEESIASSGLNIGYFMKPVDPESLLGAARAAFNGGGLLPIPSRAVATG